MANQLLREGEGVYLIEVVFELLYCVYIIVLEPRELYSKGLLRILVSPEFIQDEISFDPWSRRERQVSIEPNHDVEKDTPHHQLGHHTAAHSATD